MFAWVARMDAIVCLPVWACVCCWVVSTLTVFFFVMIRRPPRSTLDRSSAASDVYKRQVLLLPGEFVWLDLVIPAGDPLWHDDVGRAMVWVLSLIHISEPTRPY